MKNVLRVFVLLFFLKIGTAAAATTHVPTELQGFWQFEERQQDWGGMNVGNNFVEIYFDLMTVDSLTHSGKEYTLYLTREKNQHMTVTFELLANDSALFKVAARGVSLMCKHLDRDPELNYLSKKAYSNVFSGKWYTGSNARESFAVERGKLLYGGKRWTICWLGEDKNHEYRAIIENEGAHRLIRMAKMKEDSLMVSYYGKPTIYQKQEASKLLTMYGNWYEPDSNAWVFGFFEKFAIYKGKFWDYKTLSVQKNKGTGTLQNGNELLQLSFQQIKDSSMKVVINKEKAVTFRLAGRTLPHYKTSDTTSFVDTHYARIDTAYITGYVRYRSSNKPFEVSIADPITDKEISYYGNVDHMGRFEMKVPLYNSSMAFMDWRTDMRQINVLEPNEHYVVFYDATTKQTLFMGKNTRFQNELATVDLDYIPRRERVSGQEPLTILGFQQQLFSKKKDYVNGLLSQRPSPSAKIRYFLDNYIKYEVASELMQQRYGLNRETNELFPDEYMNFVKNELLPNPPHPMTLSRDFFLFIRDYVGYCNERLNVFSVSPFDALLSLDNSGKLKLDSSDKERVVSVQTLIGMITKGDSVQAKKASKTLTQKQINEVNEIISRYQDKISTEISRLLFGMHLKGTVEIFNTEIQDKGIRDYSVANVLYMKLNNDRVPMDSTLLDSFLVHVESPAFRDKVKDAQKFYTELSGRSLEHLESLKNTEFLSYAKSADSLWVELIRPYKGKIIYVDFWGTWCGPCKKEMEYVPNLKKQFVGKDIVFMYLANNSPEQSWKNEIKINSLTGENVVHYNLPTEQQEMIEQRFGIHSFPTYLIVDRNGNVADTKPPRPSQMDVTVGFLNDWLEKK